MQALIEVLNTCFNHLFAKSLILSFLSHFSIASPAFSLRSVYWVGLAVLFGKAPSSKLWEFPTGTTATISSFSPMTRNTQPI